MQIKYLACALALAPSMVSAQAVVQPIAAAPIAPSNSGNAVLRIGTEVPLKLSEELTTKGKKLKLGQRFHLETSEAVFVQGVEVIPVGSVAVGEITDVRNKGMWGKSGHLGARVLYVTVNGRQIRLTGNFDDKGTAGGIGATAVSAIDEARRVQRWRLNHYGRQLFGAFDRTPWPIGRSASSSPPRSSIEEIAAGMGYLGGNDGPR